MSGHGRGSLFRPDSVPPPEATCWICLESGPSESEGDPLTRNCACRGSSAGYAHASCLAEHAKRRSKTAVELAEKTGNYQGGRSAGDPWSKCPQCEKHFAGPLAVAMAERFVASCPGVPDFAYPRFYALLQLGEARLDCGDVDGSIEVYENLLEEFDGVKAMNQMMGMGCQGIGDKEVDILEGAAMAYMGRARSREVPVPTQKASVRKARDYGERALAIIVDLFGAHCRRALSIKTMLKPIQMACAMADGKEQPEEHTGLALEDARRSYDGYREDFGPESQECLGSALGLALALERHGQVMDAVDLLEKSLKTSQLSLGRDHTTTKLLEKALADAGKSKKRVKQKNTSSEKHAARTEEEAEKAAAELLAELDLEEKKAAGKASKGGQKTNKKKTNKKKKGKKK